MHVKSAWYQRRFLIRQLLSGCKMQDASFETLCSDDGASRRDVFESASTNINSESFFLEMSKVIVYS